MALILKNKNVLGEQTWWLKMDNDTIVQKILDTFKVLKAVSIEFFF